MDAAAEESKETSYQEGAGQPEQQKIEMFDKELYNLGLEEKGGGQVNEDCGKCFTAQCYVYI